MKLQLHIDNNNSELLFKYSKNVGRHHLKKGVTDVLYSYTRGGAENGPPFLNRRFRSNRLFSPPDLDPVIGTEDTPLSD
jgi:hypothetical protein